MFCGHADNVLRLGITDRFGLESLHGLSLRADETPLTVAAISFIFVAARALALYNESTCRQSRVTQIAVVNTYSAIGMTSMAVSWREGPRLAESARKSRCDNAPVTFELVLAAGRAVQHSARPLSRLASTVGLGVAVVGHDEGGDGLGKGESLRVGTDKCVA